MAAKAQTYKGMRDYLPPAMRLRQHIVDTLTAVATRHGFEPMQTPIVEYEETIAGKLGDDEKLIYRLQYGDDRLALRYDQTVSLARVVAQYPNELAFPFRRYAIGPSYRGERQQRGRFREFYQFDLDIVGAGDTLADAEVVAVIVESLTSLGFSGFRVLLNHREVLTALARVAGVPDEVAAGVYRAVDKFDKIGVGGVHDQLLANGLQADQARRIADFVAIDGPSATILGALRETLDRDERGLAAVAELESAVAHLDAMLVPADLYTVAPRLARGLSYYTGIVFEAVVEQPPIGSLLGGGRYDNLIGTFAGRQVPTVGTAFGIERLQIVMTELGLLPDLHGGAAAYVTIFSPELAVPALHLAHDLRAAGIPTITALTTDKLGKQLKEAAAKQIPYAVILGPDEISQSVVVLRDLRTGEQQTVALESVAATIRRALA